MPRAAGVRAGPFSVRLLQHTNVAVLLLNASVWRASTSSSAPGSRCARPSLQLAPSPATIAHPGRPDLWSDARPSPAFTHGPHTRAFSEGTSPPRSAAVDGVTLALRLHACLLPPHAFPEGVSPLRCARGGTATLRAPPLVGRLLLRYRVGGTSLPTAEEGTAFQRATVGSCVRTPYAALIAAALVRAQPGAGSSTAAAAFSPRSAKAPRGRAAHRVVPATVARGWALSSRAHSHCTLSPLPPCAHNCGEVASDEFYRAALASHSTPTGHLAAADYIRPGAVRTAEEGTASQRATVGVHSPPRLSAHVIDPWLEGATELALAPSARVLRGCTTPEHALAVEPTCAAPSLAGGRAGGTPSRSTHCTCAPPCSPPRPAAHSPSTLLNGGLAYTIDPSHARQYSAPLLRGLHLCCRESSLRTLSAPRCRCGFKTIPHVLRHRRALVHTVLHQLSQLDARAPEPADSTSTRATGLMRPCSRVDVPCPTAAGLACAARPRRFDIQRLTRPPTTSTCRARGTLRAANGAVFIAPAPCRSRVGGTVLISGELACTARRLTSTAAGVKACGCWHTPLATACPPTTGELLRAAGVRAGPSPSRAAA
ncbi:hypothetical protein B0H14DRAFT_3488982 [Mycena olivaceomarginata]|nr:hypothetical protein B0H14DRAFT_3488982 [Mycena olivaceomarginata]